MGCKHIKSRAISKQQCPLCKKEGNYIHHVVVSSVVKEDLSRIVIEDDYFVCPNSACDTVIYHHEGEQIFLIQDMDLKADFSSLCDRTEKKCDSCKNTCSICP